MKGVMSPLKRHVLIRLLLTAGLLSALLLVAFLAAYRSQLVGERSRASLGFNLLLQAALENAMLKRDVPGLAEIVAHLGTQPGIEGVMILNPRGVVRFASTPRWLGATFTELVQTTDAPPSAQFTQLDDGREVLRSINPVRNKQPCKPCHGAAELHPVNGILVIDYEASEIRTHAWKSALSFSAAGLAVLALIMAVLWRFLNRRVLEPVAALSATTTAIEQGELGRRVQLGGDDEFAALGACFNRMAEHLETQMARLKAHQLYLQHIVDGMPDGVRVIRASDRRVVLANRAFCQQIGHSPQEVIGQTCHYYSHGRHTPCAPTLVVCPLHELQNVGDTLKVTHHHHRADGTPFPAEIHATLIELDESDRNERFIIESVRDMSQTAEISQEQRLSELGLLAAGIAHEIHNPLGSVRLGVQGLAREIEDQRVSPQQIADYLKLIDREIDDCVAVTRRLLLLAQPPSNNLQLVDINTAIDDTLKLLAYDAQNRGITQRRELPETPLRLLCDEGELRMILLNLMQNAHHAMPHGGILSARLAAKDGQGIIEIADSGVGMTPDIQARIFDPFFSQRADGERGTGMGLTLVKNFVDRMGGTIAVHSLPELGTCFRISLPLAENALDTHP